jgi:aerobic-type carbon monoxide dehydrogenase small subunit (CoxS/CutS family)
MKNPKEFSLIKLNVNRAPHQVGADPTRSLLDYLRKDLGLTGAKNGCDQKGICGACTVIVNGKAVKSCQLKLNQLDNAEIITIEGLSNGDTLHPLQKAFISEGAIQCGFCTSGMIMAAKALLEQNPLPSSIDIKRALKGNLCRCGTYPKVIRAIQKAATSISSGSEKKEKKYSPHNYIGAPLPIKRASEKVTGRLKFIDDLSEEDMLFGKIVWSKYAHAKIKKINTAIAKEIPGVLAVLTAADVPGKNVFGAIKADQPVLTQDKVRYLGDPIVLVIGENKYAAELGCKMVEVEYNQLQPIYNPEDALTEKAPKLFPKGNLAVECALKCGDVERGIQGLAISIRRVYGGRLLTLSSYQRRIFE